MPTRSRTSRSVRAPLCKAHAVSIMVMISISYPAVLAPRASRSLGLLRLELFRLCFRFRLGHLSRVARICYIRGYSGSIALHSCSCLL
jgi:hypothetical protein